MEVTRLLLHRAARHAPLIQLPTLRAWDPSDLPTPPRILQGFWPPPYPFRELLRTSPHRPVRIRDGSMHQQPTNLLVNQLLLHLARKAHLVIMPPLRPRETCQQGPFAEASRLFTLQTLLLKSILAPVLIALKLVGLEVEAPHRLSLAVQRVAVLEASP
jgi:hypothetical protein